jgi:hypothetical protein
VSDLPLALSIGANVVLAGLAYLGARQQNETARFGIAEESERARESRDEDHFRHRQAVYHDYLDAIRALGPLMLDLGHTLADFLGWRADYEHRLNAVVLFGTPAVRDAADKMHALILLIGRDDEGNPLTQDREVNDHYWSMTDTIRDRFRAVVNAMRADLDQ